jgi:hypothetical protein
MLIEIKVLDNELYTRYAEKVPEIVKKTWRQVSGSGRKSYSNVWKLESRKNSPDRVRNRRTVKKLL